ncbi:MAG: hypothetical protein AAFV77_02245 [Planctomycetota bacterium]
MPRQPSTDAALLQYASDLFTVWSGNAGTPPDIGLSPEQVADLGITLNSAEDAKTNQIATASAAKAASTGKRNAFKDLRTKLGGLIDIVEGYAKSSGDPDVYQRAHIDPPAPPTPRSEAAQPEDVRTRVRTDGSIEVAFTVTTGGGATFDTQRQTVTLSGEAGPWTSLATIGGKEFIDPEVPVGLRQVLYRVRTTLSNGVASEWSEPSVTNFGNDGSLGGPDTFGTPETEAA